MEQRPDLLIVARGGGSLEDLWPFNEEIVVRATAASAIPLISAIGHETDTTLIDFASDFRAPTPTAAAERAVPVRADLLAELASLNARQRRTMGRVVGDAKTRLHSAARALPRPDEILATARQRLDVCASRLPKALKANVQVHAVALARSSGKLGIRPLKQRTDEQRRRLKDQKARLNKAIKQLTTRKSDQLKSELKLFASLGYQSVLKRGYAVIRDQRGKPLQAIAGIVPPADLEIEMQDGRLNVTSSTKKSQASLF
jgi:exodeoxyribonuclease VII large subunit